MNNESNKLQSGGRNLLLLGIGSALIALTTICISLMVYHNSGDIYLDRSRPGFLPDKSETELPANQKYTFSDQGVTTPSAIDEYLEKIQTHTSIIKQLNTAYSTEPLSDKSLGISKDEQ